MANTQSTRTHKTSDDQNLADLERKVRRWELEHHISIQNVVEPARGCGHFSRYVEQSSLVG